ITLATIEDPPVHAMLPRLARWFNERYPLIELCIESRNSSAIRQGIVAGEVSAGFFVSDRLDDNLQGYQAGRREFVIVAPPNWAGRVSSVDWADFAAWPWITTPPGSVHFEIALQLFRSHNIKIRP